MYLASAFHEKLIAKMTAATTTVPTAVPPPGLTPDPSANPPPDPIPEPGPSDPTIERIADAMSQWRLVFSRRFIGRSALQAVAPGLKLANLDVLEAVARLSASGEATVGSIAEILNIDPSRSSRMVAELVETGLLRRAVSQSDARRAVVELGAQAEVFFHAKRRLQHDLLRKITAEWSEPDKAAFSELLGRFVEGLEAGTLGGSKS